MSSQKPEDCACLIYTVSKPKPDILFLPSTFLCLPCSIQSGTTGVPKGVMISHDNVRPLPSFNSHFLHYLDTGYSRDPCLLYAHCIRTQSFITSTHTHARTHAHTHTHTSLWWERCCIGVPIAFTMEPSYFDWNPNPQKMPCVFWLFDQITWTSKCFAGTYGCFLPGVETIISYLPLSHIAAQVGPTDPVFQCPMQISSPDTTHVTCPHHTPPADA